MLNEKDAFPTEGGLLAVTDKCKAATSTICGKVVKIIDTPGFFDGFTPTEENFRQLSRALTLAKDGIHAVAFVMNYNRYTSQCEEAIQQLLRLKGLQPFVFVILTHAKKMGTTKAETDEYIQQTLLNPHCPAGLKDLMQVVENRVIMLESVDFIAENYCEQKRKELMELVETLHKSNGYNTYVDPMLHFTAQIYDEVKLHQKAEIREKTRMLKLSSEKIEQLKKRADHTKDTEGAKMVNNEIAELNNQVAEVEKKFDLIADELYPENRTNEILVDVMQKIVRNHKDQISDKFMLYMLSYIFHHGRISRRFNVVGKSAAGAIVGAGIRVAVNAVVKAYDYCKQQ